MPSSRSTSRKRKREKGVSKTSSSYSCRARMKTSDWHDQCLTTFTQFIKLADAEPFLEPVDEEEHEAPDYYSIVQSPMDFGKIAAKLRQGTYKEIGEFFKDVELVFFNCRLYNVIWDHAVHQKSCDLQKMFKIKFKSLCEKFGDKNDIDAWGSELYLGPFTDHSDEL